jgi:glycerate 2-kinase
MTEEPDFKEHLMKIYMAAVDAVRPCNLISRYVNLHEGRFKIGEDVFPFDQFDKIYVAGAGKATAAMAAEVEKILKHHVEEGVIAIRDQFDYPFRYIRTVQAGHPLPDENSVIASEEIDKVLRKLTRNDLLIFLLSGGASSLMMDIPQGCTLRDIHTVLEKLLKCGATIAEVNTVRKHLSEMKGGQLVKKCSGATIVNLIISDVIGNDLQVIGSGPLVADESTFRDAMMIMDKYELTNSCPYSIKSYLHAGIEGNIPDTPKPGDGVFNNTRNVIIADLRQALNSAKKKADELGYHTHIATDSLSGYADEVAKEWAHKAKMMRKKNICTLAGGETTVQVKGSGKGGRNLQFALAAAMALHDSSDIMLLAAGTDGSDGPTDAAGAIVTSETFANAVKNGLNPAQFLENNDAYNFFRLAGGLIKTGPTHTNVMDLVITIKK